jgi:tetratricopeptide (TPR) repeat protein
MRKPTLEEAAPAFALLAIVVLAWWAYSPGVNGGFLFDDFGNLPALGATGPIDNAAAFWRYVTSGSADPTGRPLALLSFLIDANDWPADPYPFKRTSVLLHLLNGVLLTWVLLRLGRVLGIPRHRAELGAAIGASLWLLHPLLVSTTLYVVQREAMLPATFILAGLLGYVSGRESVVRGRTRGAWLAAASIITCTLLAVLAKANGALLPLFTLIVEAVILAPHARVSGAAARAFARVRRFALVIPSVLLLAYLALIAWKGFAHGVGAERSWTLGERLLTEARIVCNYLALLWWPRPFTAGLFNDAYQASTGLLSPPTTLLSIALIGALLALAVASKRRHPALSAAILFFFAGHLLESTVVPLELYFEHRNYVPAMLMFWPLALWLCNGPKAERVPVAGSLPGPAKGIAIPANLRLALAAVLALAFAALTWMRADLWGSPQDQALIWALKNPDSPRAQAYAAQIEIERGKVADASRRLEKALSERPEEVQLALNLIGAHCTMGTLTHEDIDRAAHALANSPNTGRLGYDWFERSLPIAARGSCANLDLDAIDRLLDAAADNPRTRNIPGRVQDVAHLRGRVALLRGDGPGALTLFDEALRADTRPGAALEQAGILARAGYPDLALRHLDLLEQLGPKSDGPRLGMTALHDWLLQRDGYWQHEISHLRRTLETDLAAHTESQGASE